MLRITVRLDDDLVTEAREYTGIQEKSGLIREALKALVAREAARRLARLGGTMPDLESIPAVGPSRMQSALWSRDKRLRAMVDRLSLGAKLAH